MRTTEFNIRLVTLSAVVAGMLLILSIPIASHAQGKPDVTGQDRAAQAGKPDSPGNKPESPGDASGDSSVGAQSTPGKSAHADRGHGLDRAASAGNKPERIRNQLMYIRMLLQQLRDVTEGRGIGRELSAFIEGGRVLPDSGDDTDGETPSDVAELVAGFSTSTEKFNENSTSTEEDDTGTFVIEIEVTASDADLMIPTSAGTDDATTTGFVVSVRNASGTEAMGTTTTSVSSTADQDVGFYQVGEGETETFTVTVVFDPEEMGTYFVQLVTINSDAGSEDLTPPEDFQSGALEI